MDESLERKKPDTVTDVLDLCQELEEFKRTRNREKLVSALRDETLIKQFEAAIDAEEIREKALEVLRKRIDSREISDSMLLRIIASLAKSTAGLV
jgi:hypothetical protein